MRDHPICSYEVTSGISKRIKGFGTGGTLRCTGSDWSRSRQEQGRVGVRWTPHRNAGPSRKRGDNYGIRIRGSSSPSDPIVITFVGSRSSPGADGYDGAVRADPACLGIRSGSRVLASTKRGPPVRQVVTLSRDSTSVFVQSRGPLGLVGQRLPKPSPSSASNSPESSSPPDRLGPAQAIRDLRPFTTFAFIGFSVPTFFTGLLLIIIFSVKLHWLPFIYDSTLKITNLATLGDQIKQSIMPITVLALFNTATIARYTRSEMLEHLPLDYVRTARSKGLKERFVVLRHVLRIAFPRRHADRDRIPRVVARRHRPDIPRSWDRELRVRFLGKGDTPRRRDMLIFEVLVVLFNLIADVLYG